MVAKTGGIQVAVFLGKIVCNCIFKETLNKWIPLMVRCFGRLSITTNGINNLPFVLSLSKDLFSVSLNEA